jgi:hypothetical protein
LRGQLGGRNVFEATAIGTNGGAHTADHNNFTAHGNVSRNKEIEITEKIDMPVSGAIATLS